MFQDMGRNVSYDLIYIAHGKPDLFQQFASDFCFVFKKDTNIHIKRFLQRYYEYDLSFILFHAINIMIIKRKTLILHNSCCFGLKYHKHYTFQCKLIKHLYAYNNLVRGTQFYPQPSCLRLRLCL